MTQPIFVLGSGRCGTKAIADILAMYDNVESNHQYAMPLVAALGAKYFSARLSVNQAKLALMPLHKTAVNFCQAENWADVSNKLCWLVEPIRQLFPNAKYIHLVRDGRKVVSSYYNKLSNNHYAKFKDLENYLYGAGQQPPYEERFWWPVEYASVYRKDGYDRFQYTCWHWAKCNKLVRDGLRLVDNDKQIEVRLEDLSANPNEISRVLEFLELPYKDEAWQMLQRPHNVIEPRYYGLTKEQTEIFWGMDWVKHEMDYWGYDRSDDYEVEY